MARIEQRRHMEASPTIASRYKHDWPGNNAGLFYLPMLTAEKARRKVSRDRAQVTHDVSSCLETGNWQKNNEWSVADWTTSRCDLYELTPDLKHGHSNSEE